MDDKTKDSYITKIIEFRAAIREMVYTGAHGPQDAMTYPLPTMKVVDYLLHETDHGTFWLKKYLFIMPIEDSGLTFKIVFFAAYDKQEHTIYYTVSQRKETNDDNPPTVENVNRVKTQGYLKGYFDRKKFSNNRQDK